LTGLALLLSLWGAVNRRPHDYYGAAVRSMSDSWHAFVYGALDPSSFITVDKIPGAFWPQAIAVRIFGYHPWALALPEALACAATVIVLFRVVRRWAGAGAGLVAAAAYATTPVVVVLARTTIPDTLLVFLLVAATERLWSALENGRRRDLVLSGVLLGLAFDVKMLQALLVVPAFVAAYALFGTSNPRRRLVDLSVLAAALVVVGAIWIAVVELTPASHRPYVAGTTGNSAIELVVHYDGLDRFHASEQRLPFGGLAGPTRLLNRQVGPQIGWLLPVAILGLVIGLARRGPRRLRAGYVLWGVWLAVHAIAFSGSSYGIHPYYTAALAPAVAALVGAALVGAWRSRLLVVYAALAAVTAWLITVRAHYLEWAPIAVLLALVALRRPADDRLRVLAVGGLLLVPAIWSVDSLRQPQTFWGSINPVAGPYAGGINGPDPVADRAALGQLAAYLSAHAGTRYVAATTDALTGAPLIADFNLRVLPLGGLSGSDPAPTEAALARLVDAHAFRYVVYRSPAPTGPAEARSAWLLQACHPVEASLPALRAMRARLLDCG
jgi:4-amino-4-deoxy-L-arabinose transferase-like glycosyltransferase